jgi:hypothetical protein
MGFGNCILFRNSKANMETVGDYGESFDGSLGTSSLTEKLIALIADRSRVEARRKDVRQRVDHYYNWEWITDFYQDMFTRLMARRPLLAYDEFLTAQSTGVPK